MFIMTFADPRKRCGTVLDPPSAACADVGNQGTSALAFLGAVLLFGAQLVTCLRFCRIGGGLSCNGCLWQVATASTASEATDRMRRRAGVRLNVYGYSTSIFALSALLTGFSLWGVVLFGCWAHEKCYLTSCPWRALGLDTGGFVTAALLSVALIAVLVRFYLVSHTRLIFSAFAKLERALTPTASASPQPAAVPANCSAASEQQAAPPVLLKLSAHVEDVSTIIRNHRNLTVQWVLRDMHAVVDLSGTVLFCYYGFLAKYACTQPSSAPLCPSCA